jgi:cob(I)alamin adenosyltransferase
VFAIKKGLVHIYTGDGKGKTTSAVGLAVRAFGRGMRIIFAQFLKDGVSGEIKILNELGNGFRVCKSGFAGKFTWQMDESELCEARKEQNSFLDAVIAEAFSGGWDMLVLDEILVAVDQGIIDESRVEELIKEKPEDLELVLTGRSAPESLVRIADYVSEIKAVKHPYEKGIGARIGIEE